MYSAYVKCFAIEGVPRRFIERVFSIARRFIEAVDRIGYPEIYF